MRAFTIQSFNCKVIQGPFFFFFFEIEFQPFLMIALYHQTKISISFWCRQGVNPRFLIQPSKTLPIELTGTHYLRPIWYPYLSNNFHISNTLFHPHVFQKTTKISSQTTLPNIRQCFKFLDLQSLNSELCFFLFFFLLH